MIRTILVLLFLLCFFIISIPLYLIEAIIGHFDIHKKERSSFVIVTTALKIIIWLSGIHLKKSQRISRSSMFPIIEAISIS